MRLAVGWRRHLVAGALAAVVLAVGVIWVINDSHSSPKHLAETRDYLPGLVADVYLPERISALPVVILIPGGGWETADREGLGPLADALAGAGMITVNVTYRAAAAGARFPEPLSDVECAVDFAVDTTTRLSGTSVTAQPVVLLGHSAGAHLAALSALTGDRFRKNCPYPHVDVDAVVGLSGAYDIDRLRYLAWPLFGHDVAVAPEAWRQGNPLTWVGERQDDPLRVLLVHGAADDVVPLSSTRTFAAALRRSGHAVNVVELNGADHVDTLATNQVGSLILEWVRRLPPHGDSAASRTP